MVFLCALVALGALTQDASVLLQQGLIALQQGRLEAARDSFEAGTKLDAKNPYLWISLAETFRKLKRPQHASAAARAAEKVRSEDPIVWHALAMYYSESGDFGKAAGLESRFAESAKADLEATARAAGLYLEAGDAEKALSLARQSVTQRASAAHEDLLGRTLVASGQLDEAIQHLRTAFREAPEDPNSAFDFAQALLKTEQFSDAAETLNVALQAHPENAQLVLAMGVARYGQRRFEDSIVLFLKVVGLDPTIEQPYVFMGRMLDQAGTHLPDILGAYRAWAQRAPKNTTANLLVGKALLAASGNDQEAEDSLRRSIAIDGRNWESHYELGVLLSKKRQYPEALAELLQSITLNAKQPAPHYQLARVYDRLGQPEKARAERELHEKLSPSSASSTRP